MKPETLEKIEATHRKIVECTEQIIDHTDGYLPEWRDDVVTDACARIGELVGEALRAAQEEDA